MNDLPHRFRLSQVMRFVRPISQAVEAYPQVVKFDPTPLASTTYAARLRDAMASLKTHQWVIHHVDLEAFNKVYEDLIVTEKVLSGRTWVCVGSKEALRQPLQGGVEQTVRKAQLTVTNPSNETVLSLAHLCHVRAFPDFLLPVRLIGDVDPEQTSRLEDKYDIAFTRQADGTHTLI